MHKRILYRAKCRLISLLSLQCTHVLGDSHTGVFTRFKGKPFYFFNILTVPGATISGIPNPKSKTQAGPKFRQYIEDRVYRNDYVILQLGEVDCGFVLWLRSEKYGLPIEQLLDSSVENYKTLIELVIRHQKKPARVYVTSTMPPTIKDDQDWGDVANLRGEVKASQHERTRLTLEFNRRVAQMCGELGVNYIDLDKDLIDGDTNLVKSEYLNENKYNHHLANGKLSKLMYQKFADEDVKLTFR